MEDMNTLTTTTSSTSTQSSMHKRHSPPPPIPSARRNSRFSFNLAGALPTPDLLSSIPSGAHYAGAPSVTHHDRGHLGAKHRRSSSHGTDDPVLLENVYKEAMDDLTEMYCGRTTLEILQRRWKLDAEFEDPMCLCKGFDQYAPQWFALPRLFSDCECVSTRILSANLNPNRVVYAQTQIYTFRWFGIKKTINSIIVVDFDDEFKVVRLVDQWNGDQLPTRWGSLYLRRFNAKFIPWLVHVPKDKAS